MEVCCGGILGMGETLEQRAEFAANLAELDPHEVPLNFLNPRPGTPFGDLEVLPASEALKAVAAFRLALPRTMLRFAGGREITLGDLGAKQGILGGINAVIVGNYLTTLGRPAEADLRAARRSADADQGAERQPLDRSGDGHRSSELPAPVGAGVSTSTPARGGQHVPAAAQLGLEPPRFCADVRTADDRAGAPRRLVGEVLAARAEWTPRTWSVAMSLRDEPMQPMAADLETAVGHRVEPPRVSRTQGRC